MTARAIPFNQHTIDEFHAKQGRGVGRWGDHLLLLTAKGGHSGQEITTPLVTRPLDDGEQVVIASKGGAPENPQWFDNITVNPEVEIEVPTADGTETYRARVDRVLTDGPERDRLYAYMVEVWPAFAEYETKTDRKIPVVVFKPAEGTG